jgi:hypothetical protein
MITEVVCAAVGTVLIISYPVSTIIVGRRQTTGRRLQRAGDLTGTPGEHAGPEGEWQPVHVPGAPSRHRPRHRLRNHDHTQIIPAGELQVLLAEEEARQLLARADLQERTEPAP